MMKLPNRFPSTASINRTGSINRPGFSLVELLIAIGIIIVLLAITFPVIQSGRAASRRTVCLNKLRLLSLATMNYESSAGELPVGIVVPPGSSGSSVKPLFTWAIYLRPFLEEINSQSDDLFRGERVEVAEMLNRGGEAAASALRTASPNYRCPSDIHSEEVNKIRKIPEPIGNLPISNYVGANNVGVCHGLRNGITRKIPNGAFQGIEAESFAGIEDGASQTVLFSERLLNRYRQDAPDPGAGLQYVCRGVGNPADPAQPGFQDAAFAAAGGINRFEFSTDALVRHGVSSGHPGGANIALADGSSRFLSEETESYYNGKDTFERPQSNDDYGVWERLIATTDGQVVEAF